MAFVDVRRDHRFAPAEILRDIADARAGLENARAQVAALVTTINTLLALKDPAK